MWRSTAGRTRRCASRRAQLAMPVEEARALFPRGAPDLVAGFSRWADRRMLDWFEAAPPEEPAPRARIKRALGLRFEVVAPWREAVRRALSVLALPPHAALGAAAALRDGRRHLVRRRRHRDRFQLLHQARDARRRLRRDAAVLARRPLRGFRRDARLYRPPAGRCRAAGRGARAPRNRAGAPAKPVPPVAPGAVTVALGKSVSEANYLHACTPAAAGVAASALRASLRNASFAESRARASRPRVHRRSRNRRCTVDSSIRGDRQVLGVEQRHGLPRRVEPCCWRRSDAGYRARRAAGSRRAVRYAAASCSRMIAPKPSSGHQEHVVPDSIFGSGTIIAERRQKRMRAVARAGRFDMSARHSSRDVGAGKDQGEGGRLRRYARACLAQHASAIRVPLCQIPALATTSSALIVSRPRRYRRQVETICAAFLARFKGPARNYRRQ